MEDREVFLRYLAFTVPHVTVFAGAVFGILVLLGIGIKIALGVFALLYGLMLVITAIIVRDYFSEVLYYRLYVLFSLFLLVAGILLLGFSIS